MADPNGRAVGAASGMTEAAEGDGGTRGATGRGPEGREERRPAWEGERRATLGWGKGGMEVEVGERSWEPAAAECVRPARESREEDGRDGGGGLCSILGMLGMLDCRIPA